jgi:DNA-binding NtrC family response regulator
MPRRSQSDAQLGGLDGGPIIGGSPAIRALRRDIARVAPAEATVLILGERGTGKELVARALQASSRRRDRPFVVVNCAALPGELVAIELFGHERGAFTGAVQRAPGLLDAADGGTLFLDEVGDLPLPAQAMLLRFLQGGEVRPVGSARTVRVDVRVIAATNKDLPRATNRGEFRADLYDRLSEIVFEVPPLRDRREDSRLLVTHFVEMYTSRHHVTVRGLLPEARRALQAYDWPGNVRELEKAVSRAVIYANGGWIHIEDLGLPVPAGPRESSSNPVLARRAERGALSLRQREVLRIAAAHGVVCRRDVMALSGISREAARRELAGLVERGLLRKMGIGRGARYGAVASDTDPGIRPPI